MADVFEKIGNGLKNTIKQATTQTQQSVNQVSYRTDILTKKNELKKLYQALGEMAYEAHKKGEEPPELATIYNKVDLLQQDIVQLEEKLEQVVQTQKESFESYKKDVKSTWEDIVNDNNKGQSESKTDPLDSEDIESDLKICPECHTSNHQYAAYCIHCGHKFE